jgi:ferritin-like metal-binding protein YciE
MTDANLCETDQHTLRVEDIYDSDNTVQMNCSTCDAGATFALTGEWEGNSND